MSAHQQRRQQSSQQSGPPLRLGGVGKHCLVNFLLLLFIDFVRMHNQHTQHWKTAILLLLLLLQLLHSHTQRERHPGLQCGYNCQNARLVSDWLEASGRRVMKCYMCVCAQWIIADVYVALYIYVCALPVRRRRRLTPRETQSKLSLPNEKKAIISIKMTVYCRFVDIEVQFMCVTATTTTGELVSNNVTVAARWRLAFETGSRERTQKVNKIKIYIPFLPLQTSSASHIQIVSNSWLKLNLFLICVFINY